MDILQSAIDTAEAIGMDLTKVETICFDVLKGYDYEQLVSLCDKKIKLSQLRWLFHNWNKATLC